MKLLGIDTSTRTCAVAMINEETIIGEFMVHDQRTHSERLMPLIDQLAAQTGIDLKELSGIAVSLGPGSFTGLRIGISTAAGLSMGYHIPLVGIPTLEALAYQRPRVGGYICPLMDAKRSQVYTALFKGEDSGLDPSELGSQSLEPLMGYRVMTPDELVGRLNALVPKDDVVSFVGDGVAPFKRGILENLVPRADYTLSELELNRASLVARLGYWRLIKGEVQNLDALEPIYLRKSEAERKREMEYDTT